MDILDRLLGHDAWTTHRLLVRARELSDAQLDQEFDIAHVTLRATFNHIISNIKVWTDLMRGRTIDFSLPHSTTFTGLIARFDVVYPDFAALAREIQDAERLDALWTDVLDKPPTQKTYGGAIVHVITHSMNHRAEALHIMHRLGLSDLPEGDALSWETEKRR